VTTGGAFIPEIDGLRFLAIFVVIVFHHLAEIERYYPVHIPSLVRYIGRNFDRGVVLFFVISGYILALPFARQRLAAGKAVDLRKYFLRRITRLEPPYILAMVLFAILIKLTLHLPAAHIGEHLMATLAYCHNQVFGEPSEIAPVAWSLEVEVQFYCLAPIFAFVYGISNRTWRRGILMSAILALGIVQTLIQVQPGSRLEMSIGNYAQFFLAGFLLADFILLEQQKDSSWVWDLVSLAGWPMIFALPRGWDHIALPLLLVVLCWAAFHGVLFTKFFRHPVITAIGGMCYTIYLLHFAAIAAAARLAGHTSVLKMCLISLSLISISSCLFFLLVEKPCMNPAWPAQLLAAWRRPIEKTQWRQL
jgi:peptidoglycan/LPS O-acetylase OafA/YrhL